MKARKGRLMEWRREADIKCLGYNADGAKLHNAGKAVEEKLWENEWRRTRNLLTDRCPIENERRLLRELHRIDMKAAKKGLRIAKLADKWMIDVDTRSFRRIV